MFGHELRFHVFCLLPWVIQEKKNLYLWSDKLILCIFEEMSFWHYDWAPSENCSQVLVFCDIGLFTQQAQLNFFLSHFQCSLLIRCPHTEHILPSCFCAVCLCPPPRTWQTRGAEHRSSHQFYSVGGHLKGFFSWWFVEDALFLSSETCTTV